MHVFYFFPECVKEFIILNVYFVVFSFCSCDRNHGGIDCSIEIVSHQGACSFFRLMKLVILLHCSIQIYLYKASILLFLLCNLFIRQTHLLVLYLYFFFNFSFFCQVRTFVLVNVYTFRPNLTFKRLVKLKHNSPSFLNEIV